MTPSMKLLEIGNYLVLLGKIKFYFSFDSDSNTNVSHILSSPFFSIINSFSIKLKYSVYIQYKTWVVKGQLQRQRLSLHKDPPGENKRQQVQVALGQISSQHKKRIFYGESNQPLEQPPQRHGRVPMAGGFQDMNEQGAR